ncbi:MAG: xanthine dehydrogenase family protein subunit M [Holophaga sp.]|nr:xanthine dehydrogenase family protein subunit M [Holophaga sp.]
MRGDVPQCVVKVPATLQEALETLAGEPGRWRPLAGGTDLMVPFAAGRLADTCFLSLQRLDPLRGIQADDEGITFGALVTYTDLIRHPYVQRHLPNLAKSARVTGAVAIQNRGTLGGNLVNGSPAADSPPSLLAYGARLELTGLRGSRWVPVEAFHTGYKQTVMAPDELLTRIRVPKLLPGFHFYRKVGTRAAQAVAKVCLAAYARIEAGVVREFRVGLGSVAPVPIRARAAEAVILGQPLDRLPVAEARAALMADIHPIDDIRSTARYRRTVAGNVLVQALAELVGDLNIQS